MMLDDDPSKRPTTLGIRSRLSISNKETRDELNSGDNEKSHFDWPQMRRNSSVTGSSNSGSSSSVSWEYIS